MQATRETGVINLRAMPADLKRKFKRQCADEGVTMRDKLLELIHDYLTARPAKSPKK